MFYETVRSLFYCSVVLLVLVSINGGKNAEESPCQAKKEPNTIVNIKESIAKGLSTKVVKGLKLKDESSCMENCCNQSECTVYVYYDSPERPVNCFLIKCLPTSNCVRSNLSGSVVGVMDENNLVQAPPVLASHVDSSKLRTVSTTTSKDGVMLETTLSETPIGTTSSIVQQIEQREANSNNSSQAPVSHSIASTAPITTITHSTATPTQATTPHVKAKHAKHPTEGHDHTNKTSLIIALFFGILFLLAVMVIVGRPWWDFMHRPRYSKVDYLMNGL